MLTIFTIPKAFHELNEIIQMNAIHSWLALDPRPERILLGKDEGTAEIASRLAVKHVAEIECNEYGTPLVSSMFSIAQDIASHPVMCYINADIILLSDFIPAVRRVKEKTFLIVGQRTDLDIKEMIDFENSEWEISLRDLVKAKGKLHPPSGIDYFVFNRGLYRDILPFAIGRTAWDNWLVYQSRKLKASLIDATPAITAIHQNHDYSHHPQGESAVWKGPEAIRNKELLGGKDYSFDPQHASLVLTPRGTKRALSMRRVYFQMRSIPALYPRFYFLLSVFKLLERLILNFRQKQT